MVYQITSTTTKQVMKPSYHKTSPSWRITDRQYQNLNAVIIFCHALFLLQVILLKQNSTITSGPLSGVTLSLWSLCILSMLYLFKTLIVERIIKYLQLSFPAWTIASILAIQLDIIPLVTITAAYSCLYICLSSVHGSIVGLTGESFSQQTEQITSPLSTVFLALSLASLASLLLIYSHNHELITSSLLMICGIIGSFFLYYFKKTAIASHTEPIHSTHVSCSLIYYQLTQYNLILFCVALSQITGFLYTSKYFLRNDSLTNVEFLLLLATLFFTTFTSHSQTRRQFLTQEKPVTVFQYSLISTLVLIILLITVITSKQLDPLQQIMSAVMVGISSGILIGCHFPYVRDEHNTADVFLRILTVSIGSICSITLTMLSLKYLFSITTWLQVILVIHVIQVGRMLFHYPREICAKSILLTLKYVYNLKVTGLESLNHLSSPYLIISNHCSFLDVPTIASVIKDCNSFPIYPYLTQWRCVKKAIAHLGVHVFPLSTHNPAQLKSVIRTIQSGNTCLIFPEGRICYHGHLSKIYPGTELLIEKANVQVLPIYFEGPESSPFGRAQSCYFPRITLHIGKPLTKSELFPTVSVTQKRLFKSNRIADVLLNTVLTQNHHQDIIELIHHNRSKLKLHKELLNDSFNTAINYKQLFGLTNRVKSYLQAHTAENKPWLLVFPNCCLRTACVLSGLTLNRPIIEAMPSEVHSLIDCINKQSLAIEIILAPEAYLADFEHMSFEELTNSGLKVIQLPNFNTQQYKNNYINQSTNLKNAQQTTIITAKKKGDSDTFDFHAFSQEQIIANIKGIVLTNHLNCHDKLYNAASLGSSFQSVIATFLPIVHGIPTFLQSIKINLSGLIEDIYDYSPTLLFSDSDLIDAVSKIDQPYAFHSLKQVFFPAGELSHTTEEKLQYRFNLLWANYISSPSCPLIAIRSPHHGSAKYIGKMLASIQLTCDTQQVLIHGYTIGEHITIEQIPVSIQPYQTSKLPSQYTLTEFDYVVPHDAVD